MRRRAECYSTPGANLPFLAHAPFRSLRLVVRVGGGFAHRLVDVLHVANEFDVSCNVFAARFHALVRMPARLLRPHKPQP